MATILLLFLPALRGRSKKTRVMTKRFLHLVMPGRTLCMYPQLFSSYFMYETAAHNLTTPLHNQTYLLPLPNTLVHKTVSTFSADCVILATLKQK